LTDEIGLARVQIRELVDAGAPVTRVLAALRTVSLLASLQHRFDHAPSPAAS